MKTQTILVAVLLTAVSALADNNTRTCTSGVLNPEDQYSVEVELSTAIDDGINFRILQLATDKLFGPIEGQIQEFVEGEDSDEFKGENFSLKIFSQPEYDTTLPIYKAELQANEVNLGQPVQLLCN